MLETICFIMRNILFPKEKQNVSYMGTMVKQYSDKV